MTNTCWLLNRKLLKVHLRFESSRSPNTGSVTRYCEKHYSISQVIAGLKKESQWNETSHFDLAGNCTLFFYLSNLSHSFSQNSTFIWFDMEIVNVTQISRYQLSQFFNVFAFLLTSTLLTAADQARNQRHRFVYLHTILYKTCVHSEQQCTSLNNHPFNLGSSYSHSKHQSEGQMHVFCYTAVWFASFKRILSKNLYQEDRRTLLIKTNPSGFTLLFYCQI